VFGLEIGLGSRSGPGLETPEVQNVWVWKG